MKTTGALMGTPDDIDVKKRFIQEGNDDVLHKQ